VLRIKQNQCIQRKYTRKHKGAVYKEGEGHTCCRATRCRGRRSPSRGSTLSSGGSTDTGRAGDRDDKSHMLTLSTMSPSVTSL